MWRPRRVVTIIPRSGAGRHSPSAEVSGLNTSGILSSPIVSNTSIRPAPPVTRRWSSSSRWTRFAAATASRRAAATGDLVTACAPWTARLEELGKAQEFFAIPGREFSGSARECLHAFGQWRRLRTTRKRLNRLAVKLGETLEFDGIHLAPAVLHE